MMVDYRFFYDRNGQGYRACGVVRNAVTKQIIDVGDEVLTVSEAMDGIDRYIDNPPVIGYFIEQAILRTITTYGLFSQHIRQYETWPID
jgi:hypothetical protein